MEKTKKLYRGGSSFVSKFNIGNSLIDLFDTGLYNKIKPNFTQAQRTDLAFRTNEEFWQHVIENKAFIDQNVILWNFYLTEWLPMSPGLYFTENAGINRTHAQKFLVRAKSSPKEDSQWMISNANYFDKKKVAELGVNLYPRGFYREMGLAAIERGRKNY